MNEVSVSKLAATQSVIRNKFEKAYTNRIENENEVNSVMKPLTTNPTLTTTTATSAQIAGDLESKNNSFSLHNLSKTTNNAKQHDPNTLCEILRSLLVSSTTTTNADDVECMHSINAILDELRKLDIM